MENLVSVFNYNNAPVTFRTDNGTLMVNATEMAKPFGKRTNDFLSAKQTKELINSLSTVTGIPATGLISVSQGGSKQGTWLHEDVALLFAQWLSPDFYLWCNARIKELLTVGMTATQPTLEQMINDPELVIGMATKLKELRKANDKLTNQIRTYKSESSRLVRLHQEQYPKVLFSNAVETSKRSCLIAELAKILQQNGIAIGQNRLFKWMREHGYLCTNGEKHNQPSQKAMERGLFEIKQTTINKPDGTILVSCTPKITGKGQIYFVNKFLNPAEKKDN